MLFRSIVGGESGGGPVFGGFERQLLLGLRSPFVKQKLIGLISTEQTATYDELTAMIDAGKVKPSVGRVYPLADAADAVRAIATNHTAGKLVIEI